MAFSVYAIQHKRNGLIYIGITSRLLKYRWKHHQTNAYLRRTPLQRAICEDGADAFEVLCLAQDLDSETMQTRERAYIQLFGSTNPDLGYNVLSGGRWPGPAKSISESTRQRLSAWQIGRKMSAEACEKMRQAQLRRPPVVRTKEWCDRISRANLDRRGPGVGFSCRAGKWQARITLNKRRLHLGWFPTQEAAQAAHSAALKKEGRHVI